jgi:uncharacterized SAM-binding protein YcdF (DUF218 family)
VVHWARDALRGAAPTSAQEKPAPGHEESAEKVPAQARPAPDGESVGRLRSRRGRRWRRALAALAVVFVLLCAATARLFVWPAQGMPARVSAIVMLDSPGDNLSVALRLARQHRASFLAISLGTPLSGYGCPRPVPRVKLICFNPKPATTQGEAEFAGRLAKKYHWHSLAVVTITSQATRARLRMERCFAGPVYAVATAIPVTSWPYRVAYEWGALIKALVVQRSC